MSSHAVRLCLYLQQLISSLHDICQYLCAHARLGSSHARLGSQKLEFSGVTADWGGTEGIGKFKKIALMVYIKFGRIKKNDFNHSVSIKPVMSSFKVLNYERFRNRLTI